MNKYKTTKVLGDGTFGDVLKAVNRSTLEVVAIKRMKKQYKSWEECMQLSEITVLQRLNHPNIVKLKEALSYMHDNGYFHRDIKPENILVLNDTLKIADFGLAREINSKPPFSSYVSTRWYRAPEVLLRAPTYSAHIDLWAVGAIMAELYSLKPLFPGSSEIDQLFKIMAVLGAPTQSTWPDAIKYANAMNFKFPNITPTSLTNILPHASPDAIDLIYELLRYDPLKRPSATAALKHRFFHVSIPPTTLMITPSTSTLSPTQGGGLTPSMHIHPPGSGVLSTSPTSTNNNIVSSSTTTSKL
eukprot:gene7447-8713_t